MFSKTRTTSLNSGDVGRAQIDESSASALTIGNAANQARAAPIDLLRSGGTSRVPSNGCGLYPHENDGGMCQRVMIAIH